MSATELPAVGESVAIAYPRQPVRMYVVDAVTEKNIMLLTDDGSPLAFTHEDFAYLSMREPPSEADCTVYATIRRNSEMGAVTRSRERALHWAAESGEWMVRLVPAEMVSPIAAADELAATTSPPPNLNPADL